MSSLAAVMTAGAAPCEPLAARALAEAQPAPSAGPEMAVARAARHGRQMLSSPHKAARLVLLSRVQVRIEHLSLSPAAKKKIYFGAMRGLQPSF